MSESATAMQLETEPKGRLPLLLTVEETAELLRTSAKAVYCAASRGRLPGAVRIGRRLLVRRADLLPFLGIGRGSSGDNDR